MTSETCLSSLLVVSTYDIEKASSICAMMLSMSDPALPDIAPTLTGTP